jgi:hypothetical protein
MDGRAGRLRAMWPGSGSPAHDHGREAGPAAKAQPGPLPSSEGEPGRRLTLAIERAGARPSTMRASQGLFLAAATPFFSSFFFFIYFF